MPKTIEVKSILNKSKKRDSWFLDDYTLNPFSGCPFNCLYCYTRGSKYGINMEQNLSVKGNAVELLEKQLANRARKKQYGFIVLSSATDPYPKIEKELQLTRKLLKVILKYQFPVHIITKSNLIERDFDLLKAIDQTAILPEDLSHLQRGTLITFSFSTLDAKIGRLFEPGAPDPKERLGAIRKSVTQNFHTGVSLMPLLPFITDNGIQLEEYFQIFQSLKINYVMPATLTLWGKEKYHSKTLMMRTIEKHYSHLVNRYASYFDNSSQMPDFYQKAFRKKMHQLSKQYNIPLKITNSN